VTSERAVGHSSGPWRLFFGATGGMIGLAAQGGKWWALVTAVTFLVMTIMAFIQRAKTGL